MLNLVYIMYKGKPDRFKNHTRIVFKGMLNVETREALGNSLLIFLGPKLNSRTFLSIFNTSRLRLLTSLRVKEFVFNPTWR